MTTYQKTLIIIKPNLIQKNLIGEIINIFEKKKLKVVGMKMFRFQSASFLSPFSVEKFYAEHQQKPFFESMVNFMRSSPLVAICLEGENAVNFGRQIIGATNPIDAQPGTIRQIYGESIEVNAVHGSDSVEAAQREINFFFQKGEVFA
jgi:nucleoside-diphosphate kinase